MVGKCEVILKDLSEPCSMQSTLFEYFKKCVTRHSSSRLFVRFYYHFSHVCVSLDFTPIMGTLGTRQNDEKPRHKARAVDVLTEMHLDGNKKGGTVAQ